MTRKGGLGKGLEALIPGDFSSSPGSGDTFAPISMIMANPRQPRENMDEDHMQELANSIREHGILQPLIVTHEAMTGIYTLIAGERRLRAAKLAGLEKVPVIIRTATEQERLELALIENVQRTDLSPLETAEAYHKLAEEFNLSHEEISQRVGKGRVAVTNTLRLLKLPDQAKKALNEGQITEGHARAILGLPSPQGQLAALQTVINNGLNVRQAEELIRKLSGQKPPSLQSKPVDPGIKEIEERLCERLGTRVTLRHGEKGGTLTIHYYSDEELGGLLSRIIPENL
ncbi:MAG: chromosome partitioning protein ParB family [Chloroflexi bacterium]|nr:MAG: chromosome partitioning protein ParB family [Chloroflexota bacterium]